MCGLRNWSTLGLLWCFSLLRTKNKVCTGKFWVISVTMVERSCFAVAHVLTEISSESAGAPSNVQQAVQFLPVEKNYCCGKASENTLRALSHLTRCDLTVSVSSFPFLLEHSPIPPPLVRWGKQISEMTPRGNVVGTRPDENRHIPAGCWAPQIFGQTTVFGYLK